MFSVSKQKKEFISARKANTMCVFYYSDDIKADKLQDSKVIMDSDDTASIETTIRKERYKRIEHIHVRDMCKN